MWMDQRSPLTFQGRNKTKLEHVPGDLSHLTHLVWFENSAKNVIDQDTKEESVNTFGTMHFENPSQFIWFDDTPTIV